jgi:hypothetical protein
MFRVDVDTLEAYFAFDLKREADLRRLDALISEAAPSLKRHFHEGTPAGKPGMRFKMIGYGKSFYHATAGEQVEWPVVGVALQKNYISVYFAVTKRGAAVTTLTPGALANCAWAATISVSKGSTIWIYPLRQPCSARPRKFSTLTPTMFPRQCGG